MKIVSNVKLISLLTMILAVWVQCSHNFEPEPTCEDDFGGESDPVFVAYDEPPRPIGRFAAIQKAFFILKKHFVLPLKGAL